ncbi:MAG TPA: aminopeptidase P family protein [Desulfotomaculum sp.]|nr:MAG: Xaa-pro aminopeptidase [Desulfotomaculum sp. 46_80]HAG10506.1 aminopeptidase P family protein [Desulfotomaculum sp.]HBY04071.1 aminopeptidase P family protein [Desulfotomaculum sp.]
MRFTPKSELNQRCAKLQELLKLHGIDGAVMVQNADLFYFSGTIQRSHLFIPAEGSPVLLVKKTFERATEESGLDNIICLESLREIHAIIQSYSSRPLKTLGFELDILPAAQYLRYQKLFEPAKIVDASQLIRTVRMVKSPYELQILKEAADLHGEVFTMVRETLREGMTELELAALIEAYSRKKGHAGLLRVRGFNQDLVFVHICSGRNVVPSYFDGAVGGKGVSPAYAQGACEKPIARNEPVLVDYGFVHDGYMVDQTRIFCIGELPGHLIRAQEAALDILERMKKAAKPGVASGKIYDLARQAAEEGPFGKHFMGFPTPVAFVGHGIGIELDELPVFAHGFDTLLEEGMVIALEPKFVFPDGAVGVENTYLVTAEGLETMTVFEEDIVYI